MRLCFQEGVPLIFDDSFRHEVEAAPEIHNAVRLVLILDVWNPAVPLADRAGISEQLVAWSERRNSFQL